MLLVTPPQFSTRNGGIIAVIAAIFLVVVSVEVSAAVQPNAIFSFITGKRLANTQAHIQFELNQTIDRVDAGRFIVDGDFFENPAVQACILTVYNCELNTYFDVTPCTQQGNYISHGILPGECLGEPSGNCPFKCSLRFQFSDVQLGSARASYQTNVRLADANGAPLGQDVSVEMGHIGDVVTSPQFSISAIDRVWGKSGTDATFSFTTSGGGKMSATATSNITLIYPVGLLTTSSAISGVAFSSAVTASSAFSGSSTAPSVVLTLTSGSIDAGAAVTITLRGLRIGPWATATMSVFTFSISTSTDANADVPIQWGTMSSAAFIIDPSDRVPTKTGSALTLAFFSDPYVHMVAGHQITLNYPSGFFAGTSPPLVSISGTSNTATCNAPTATAIVMTLTSPTSISANTFVTITMAGLTMGGATSGTAVSTSSCLQGASGLTVISGSNLADDTFFSISIPFSFTWLSQTYAPGNVFVGSNSYVTFGAGSAVYHSLGPNNPNVPTFFIGSQNMQSTSIAQGEHALGWLLRYEGVNLGATNSNVWEILFKQAGGLEICTGVFTTTDSGVSAISDGVSQYLATFKLVPGTKYSVSTTPSTAIISGPSVSIQYSNGTMNSCLAAGVVSGEIAALPVCTAILPTSSYISSTITVTGSLFSHPCTAKVGATPSSGIAATSCSYVSATALLVVIATGTPLGASSVEVTFKSSGFAASIPGTTLTVVAAPTASALTPLAGYQSSSITVTGTNFITSAQGGACAATVGDTAAASCTISSATSVVIVLGASSAGASVDVVVAFNGGGSGAQATKTGLVVLAAPTVTSAVPTAGYIGDTITVLGTSFITTAQDAAASCSAALGGTTTSCSLVGGTLTSLKVTIGSGTTAGTTQVFVTISTSGIAFSAASASTIVTVLGAPALTSTARTAGYISDKLQPPIVDNNVGRSLLQHTTCCPYTTEVQLTGPIFSDSPSAFNSGTAGSVTVSFTGYSNWSPGQQAECCAVYISDGSLISCTAEPGNGFANIRRHTCWLKRG